MIAVPKLLDIATTFDSEGRLILGNCLFESGMLQKYTDIHREMYSHI